MKKKLVALLFSLASFSLVLGMTSCKKADVEEDKPEKIEIITDTNAEDEKEELTVQEIPENQNLLTGLGDLSEEAIGKRPVAVMVNNVTKALPQYGVAEADIIFEIVVEGNYTRFMALYGDYTKVPKICSVRSCRKYFPIYSEGFDAVYVHWGMSKSIEDYVASLNLTRYDDIVNTGGLFGRDQDRRDSGYSLEHTSYFDGRTIAEVMSQRGERTELTEDKKGPAFLFNGMEEQIKPNGEVCKEVNIEFGATTSTLVYDSETNTYLKKFNGKDQVDGVTGTQLAFTNVFVLETEIGIDEVNDVHKKFDWTGKENSVGYYISNGAVQKITWSKDNVKSYLRFFDMDGNELSINRGKSYIAINQLGQATFK